MIDFKDIISSIVILFGGYVSISCLMLGIEILKMSRQDYKRLRIASCNQKSWKRFWKGYKD